MRSQRVAPGPILRRALYWTAGCALLAGLLLGCARSTTEVTPVQATPGPQVSLPQTPAPPTDVPLTAGALTPVAAGTPAATPPPDASATPGPSPTPATPVVSPLLVAYFPAWSAGRDYRAQDIPAAKLTHVIYAFLVVSASGECASLDARADATNVAALRALKQKYPALKTLFSVGGYSHSGRFSDVALTATSRSRFAQSCIKFMQQNGFDGIDIDWEYPVSGGVSTNVRRPADKSNFTLLLGELRGELDALGNSSGQHYLLSIAAPTGPSEYANLEIDSIARAVDWFNLMGYDYYTTGSALTNFSAPLFHSPSDPARDDLHRLRYNDDATVKAFLAAGAPAAKLLLGVPFYGTAWQGVPDTNHGLYQKNKGAAKGTWADDGAIDYRDLEKNYAGKYTRYWNADAQAPWLYSPKTGIMISYDDPQSLGIKADYARTHGLGGMMIWQISSDDSQHTLVNALYAHLRP